MVDLCRTIEPKSDQINADDLIAGPRTITITRVTLCDSPTQPLAIYFAGDNGKPYKPCKSMRRVLVTIWGADGSKYIGRRLTIYRDDSVQFGKEAVGGIRISHLSHISRPVTLALTAARASRKPYTVQPLMDILSRIAAAATIEELEKLRPEMQGDAQAMSAAKARAAAIRENVESNTPAIVVPAQVETADIINQILESK